MAYNSDSFSEKLKFGQKKNEVSQSEYELTEFNTQIWIIYCFNYLRWKI